MFNLFLLAAFAFAGCAQPKFDHLRPIDKFYFHMPSYGSEKTQLSQDTNEKLLDWLQQQENWRKSSLITYATTKTIESDCVRIDYIGSDSDLAVVTVRESPDATWTRYVTPMDKTLEEIFDALTQEVSPHTDTPISGEPKN